MKSEKISNFASIMIAVVTVLGAMVACLASVAASRAGEKDFDGMTAYIKAEEAVVVNHIYAYEHLRAHAEFFKDMELSFIVLEEITGQMSDAEVNARLRLQEELSGIASELRIRFFLPGYLKDDRTYNVQRELNEAWSDDTQASDLDADKHFFEADSARSQSVLLSGNIIVFSTAFLLFTLAEVIENRWRIFFLVLGFVTMFVGLLVVFIVEFAV